jgi:hypothetical protein
VNVNLSAADLKQIDEGSSKLTLEGERLSRSGIENDRTLGKKGI